MHFNQQFYIKKLLENFEFTDVPTAKIFIKIDQQLTVLIKKTKILFFKKTIIY